MATIIDAARQVPILLRCDVVVVGGGPAGIAAAVGAAAAGADTVIIEQYGCLGGNITVCAVEPPSWYRQPGTTMPGGVGAEIERRMIDLDAVYPVSFKPSIGYSYDTEVYKYMADELITDYSITPVYHCLGAMPYVEDQTMRGVFVESKSGRGVIISKRVVDCTGDADIAARAGAPCEKGDPKTGEMVPGTLKFFATQVDLAKLEAAMDKDPDNRDPYVHKLMYAPFQRAVEAGEKPLEDSQNRIYYTSIPPCDINVNLATYDRSLDGTDVLSLTSSEINMRKRVVDVIERLNKYGEEEGFANAKLRNYAMAIGVRETRRITARYTLTADDILSGKQFDDSIGIFPIYMDGEHVKKIPYTGEYFQVPFRILVPQGIENLLVAGRCVSCTREAIPTTREMDFCMVAGQAAGAASALSVRQDVPSAIVRIDELQAELERQGLRVK